MRGEQQEATVTTSLSHKEALRRMATGHIVDSEGVIHYHIVTAPWGWAIVSLFGILLGLAVILMFFILQNRQTINRIESKQDAVISNTK